MKNMPFAIVLCFLTAGCQFDPYADSFITHQPTHKETVGEYVLSEIQMEDYAPGIEAKVKSLSSPPRIILENNGNFEAIDFPYFSEEDNRSFYHFESFRRLTGQWRIRRAGSVGNDNGGLGKPTYGLELIGLPHQLAYPYLSGNKNVDGLVFQFGDGDEGSAIVFRKK